MINLIEMKQKELVFGEIFDSKVLLLAHAFVTLYELFKADKEVWFFAVDNAPNVISDDVVSGMGKANSLRFRLAIPINWKSAILKIHSLTLIAIYKHKTCINKTEIRWMNS